MKSTVKEYRESRLYQLAFKKMQLEKNVEYIYTGGQRGWKGDVPIVRLSSRKLKKFGWTNKYNSIEALTKSIKSIYEDAKNGMFGWQ